MNEVSRLLESIELGAYVDAFARNDITEDILGDLNDADLRELGLTMGERKRFLRAVAERRARAAVSDPAAPSPAGHQAERRRLTVMFVDLVGSTALSATLDPEELSDIIREYQDAVAGVVSRYGGHIAQFLGDGVQCYFGWPQAFEDASERAVGAGLEIVRVVSKLSACGEQLACRVGIATGLVVVGDLFGETGSHEAAAAVGDTPNFAARLQQFARSGQVVISETTNRLIGGAFKVESLGRRSFKGLTGQHEIFAVTDAAIVHDRFAARTGTGTGPMVGRAAELSLLLSRWYKSVSGAGQVVMITGEAGIGKSRLSRALTEEAEREGAALIRYQCSPYYSDQAFWPIIGQLRVASGLVEEMSTDEKLDKIETLLQRSGLDEAKDRAILAELLGVDGTARYGALDLAPAARRVGNFSVLVRYIIGISDSGPLMVQLEDAHWCDPTTREFLGMLAERIAGEQIMLMITSRPEKLLALPEMQHVGTLALTKLDRAGVIEIVKRISNDTLPASMVDQIIDRTDGVPLFVEELTKALVESGELTVPASLHDTLMARLDRLPEVKEIAQIASVIGREFTSDPLAQIAALSIADVLDALERLHRVELVFSEDEDAQRYAFKHALVRDAAYESMLNRRRQEIHGRIFDLFRADPASPPGMLAHHAAEAGRFAEAVEHGRRAALEALGRPAYAEALTHFDTALGVLDRMTQTEAIKRRRLELLLLAGQARIASLGYAAPRTVATFAEAEEIARDLGDRETLIDCLYGRWAGQYVPGRNPAALEIADTISEVAAQSEDSLAKALGHRLRGTVLTMMGRVEDATEELVEAQTYYDPQTHPVHAARFGQDVGVAAKCYLIGVRTLSGAFDSADALGREVLADIDHVSHPHTSAYGLGHIAVFLAAADIQPLGEEVARSCIELSERHNLPLWAALGHASMAMAQYNAGDGREAVPRFGEALDMLASLKFDVFRPLLLPSYALGLARIGETVSASAQIADAGFLVEEYDARFAEPEVHRAEGQLALLEGNRIKARASFEHALWRARDLGHRSWELRAAHDLAEIMRADGDGARAQALLREVYDAFTEGHTMPPMRKVAQLLEATA